MKVDEIIKLIQAVSEYSLTSFELKEGDVKLSLKREKEMPQVVTVTSGMQMSTVQTSPVETTVQDQETTLEIHSDQVVTSPLVGTFYNSSAPDSDPFIKMGDTVKKGQVLGIIEAMKLMNEIESEFDGTVEAILVENEGIVEYGQPLFRIR